MTINTTPRFGLKVWTDDDDAFDREDFATSLNQLESLAARMDSGLASARPAAAIARRLHFATDTEELSLDTGGAWKSLAGTPWQSYNPALINGYVAGAGGTVVGRWRRDGLRGNVEWWARITLGTGFTFGNNYGVTIPVAASVDRSPVSTHSHFLDTGTATYDGAAALSDTFATAWVLGTAGVFLGITATVPFTWAPGDRIEIGGEYEPAA